MWGWGWRGWLERGWGLGFAGSQDTVGGQESREGQLQGAGKSPGAEGWVSVAGAGARGSFGGGPKGASLG